MAVVYLARDERLDRLVALKLLAQALAADEAFRARFIRESRAAAAVEDPHVIPVFGAGEADGLLSIPGLRPPTAWRRAAGLSEQAIRNLIDQGVVRAGGPMTIPAVAPLPMSSASLLPEEDQ
jgi:serine/threonine protein kinase